MNKAFTEILCAIHPDLQGLYQKLEGLTDKEKAEKLADELYELLIEKKPKASGYLEEVIRQIETALINYYKLLGASRGQATTERERARKYEQRQRADIIDYLIKAYILLSKVKSKAELSEIIMFMIPLRINDDTINIPAQYSSIDAVSIDLSILKLCMLKIELKQDSYKAGIIDTLEKEIRRLVNIYDYDAVEANNRTQPLKEELVRTVNNYLKGIEKYDFTEGDIKNIVSVYNDTIDGVYFAIVDKRESLTDYWLYDTMSTILCYD